MIRKQDTALILHRLNEQDEKLDAIHDEVVKTGRRVARLERWQAFIEGGLALLTVMVVPVVVYVLTLGAFGGT